MDQARACQKTRGWNNVREMESTSRVLIRPISLNIESGESVYERMTWKRAEDLVDYYADEF
jgi:hypothetical protein